MKKIALVTGGYSGESVISYKSAQTIRQHLDPAKYKVYYIDLNHNGWHYKPTADQSYPVDLNDFSIQHDGEVIHFDAVFIGMHGTPGEDGKLQGYFDMLGIPYTGCNAASSALTFNKRYTVAVAAMAGIAVARSFHLIKGMHYEPDHIISGLKLPYFVKPNNGGSSIGMSKVSGADQLIPAIEKAFAEDSQVLVEEMIQGREFTVGVFRHGQEVIVLPITEVASHKEFFDFEAKYQGKSTETTPAQLPDSWKKNLEEAAKKIYSVFNLGGVVRIDFIYNAEEDRPYMLEINTIPGQSEASIIPQQVRAKGWDLTEFYSILLDEALHRKALK